MTKTQLTAVSVQDQMYRIVRTDNPYKALLKGVYVDKIDNLSPTIHDCCIRVLGTVVDSNTCTDILAKMPVCEENKSTIVTFITEDKFKKFNAMASRSDIPNEESTIRMDCLYTDDNNFDVDSLPYLRTEEDCNSVLNGETVFYDSNCIYVIKILSREFCGNIPYYVNDVIIYLPRRVML